MTTSATSRPPLPICYRKLLLPGVCWFCYLGASNFAAMGYRYGLTDAATNLRRCCYLGHPGLLPLASTFTIMVYSAIAANLTPHRYLGHPGLLLWVCSSATMLYRRRYLGSCCKPKAASGGVAASRARPFCQRSAMLVLSAVVGNAARVTVLAAKHPFLLQASGGASSPAAAAGRPYWSMVLSAVVGDAARVAVLAVKQPILQQASGRASPPAAAVGARQSCRAGAACGSGAAEEEEKLCGDGIVGSTHMEGINTSSCTRRVLFLTRSCFSIQRIRAPQLCAIGRLRIRGIGDLIPRETLSTTLF
jgi:hypothetical protein